MDTIKEKIYQIIGLILSFGLYIWVGYEWSKCPVLDCSESFVDNWLRTIEVGSMFLGGFFATFILLPSRFFKAWFKYIFSWGFPLSVYMTYITAGSSSIPAYGKVEVVKFWGLFFAVVSVLFIATMFWREKKSK